ncbi:uncharacterized protein [Physcomitrium patens]|uniref:J domain-containing protein n=1 Tax=Physcomitrium patens TaxID=3218 RepID=A9SPX8_PHYPA|nr:uncharacterized protein LOC112280790 isoform X2 [Physcomitrium patens]PNR56039.1 hypothetical protein PHYPA_006936 [Physcomitrium patens]|eukprot:XP_024372394.1 uncharacterized protein LOC112280790 isoform X2 [Physcomitrella patens]
MTGPDFLSRLSQAFIQRCNYSSDNRNVHSRMSLESAYRALELEPGSSMDDVKAAYRRLALRCHPDLNNKDGAEFLRISAAYQRLLNKNIIIDAPRSPRTHYKSHVRAYPGPVRPFNQTAVTLWGLGLSMGCVLFGTILLWNRVESTGVPIKGPSRVIEPTSNAIKRERISALLLEKSKRPKDSEE